jgi:hypothetical protein
VGNNLPTHVGICGKRLTIPGAYMNIPSPFIVVNNAAISFTNAPSKDLGSGNIFLARTGLHSETELKQIRMITGRSIAEIETGTIKISQLPIDDFHMPIGDP